MPMSIVLHENTRFRRVSLSVDAVSDHVNDHHRYPSAYHFQRSRPLPFGTTGRPPIRLVAHAARHAGAAGCSDGHIRCAESCDRAGFNLLRARQLLRSGRSGDATPTALPASSPSTCLRPMPGTNAPLARRRGLTGMRLFTFGSTMSEQADWLDDPKSYPAWACASELGLSVCLQMSSKALPQAIRMAERFSNVSIILDHCARPDLADGPPYNAAASLFALARYPNIYLKLTPRVFTESRNGKATPETFFPRLVGEFGASRLAWGSNYPSSEGTLPQLLATARQSLICLPAADQDWIFGGTARRFTPRSWIGKTIDDVDCRKNQVAYLARRLSEHDGAQES